MKLAITCSLLAMALYGSCKATGANFNALSPRKDGALTVGVWGGQHIRLEVTHHGAELEFDCAQGSIPQKVLLDSSGRFDVAGAFSAQRGGPTRDDENNSRPVRYQGVVRDKEMTLTIVDAKTKEVIDKFSLKLGSEVRLMKCK